MRWFLFKMSIFFYIKVDNIILWDDFILKRSVFTFRKVDDNFMRLFFFRWINLSLDHFANEMQVKTYHSTMNNAGFTIIAPPAGKMTNFPTESRRRSICPIAFTTRFPSGLAHCHQAKSTHRPSQAYILIITVWLHCAYSAYQDVHFECANAVWYAMISRSIQNHRVMQYTGSGDADFLPTTECGNGPLLDCDWWRYNCESTLL